MNLKPIAGLAATAAMAGVGLAGASHAADANTAHSHAAPTATSASKVCLYRIYADDNTEAGNDEPYLTNKYGTSFWGPKPMAQGTLRTIGRLTSVGQTIKVMEKDDWGKDDWIGTHTVHSVSGRYDVYQFKNDGGRYRISVRPASAC